MIYAGILAGGIGSRMNISNMPKQFLNIGDKPIIIHTIEKFLLSNKIDRIYVGVNPDWNSYLVDIIEKDYNYLSEKIIVVDGGKDRNSTIINIISAIEKNNGLTDDDILITHDAVRPFVSIKMIEENIENCKSYNIIDTVVPAFDTIVVSEDGNFISSIPDRKTMFQGQTPQTFKINKFMEYYSKLTDEEKAKVKKAVEDVNPGSKVVVDDKGNATVTTPEGKTATITLNAKDYKWSDGQPFTIDDYIFAIEAIGNKDYTGSRYNDRYTNIVGMKDFHEGKSDKISGVEKVDDYTVKLHFEKMLPSMQLAGGAIPAYTMPKHIFKDIPVKEWEQSEYVRGSKVVGLGAFTIESVVAGESVTLKANEYFYKGRPKLDKVVMQVVSPDAIVSEMKAGNYDIATMPSAQYEAFKDLTNVTYVSAFAPSYEYIAFHLGKYDKSQGKNVTDPNAKMADVNLRQAMGYALDIDAAGENLYNGLNYGTNSLILPFFKDVYNKEQEGFTYNPEKAKQLLDEAGYKDVDGDGIRENKDGSKLQINFAARTRDAANESLVQQYLLWWKEIGLDVQLYTGRTIESNNFYEKV